MTCVSSQMIITYQASPAFTYALFAVLPSNLPLLGISWLSIDFIKTIFLFHHKQFKERTK